MRHASIARGALLYFILSCGPVSASQPEPMRVEVVSPGVTIAASVPALGHTLSV